MAPAVRGTDKYRDFDPAVLGKTDENTIGRHIGRSRSSLCPHPFDIRCFHAFIRKVKKSCQFIRSQNRNFMPTPEIYKSETPVDKIKHERRFEKDMDFLKLIQFRVKLGKSGFNVREVHVGRLFG